MILERRKFKYVFIPFILCVMIIMICPYNVKAYNIKNNILEQIGATDSSITLSFKAEGAEKYRIELRNGIEYNTNQNTIVIKYLEPASRYEVYLTGYDQYNNECIKLSRCFVTLPSKNTNSTPKIIVTSFGHDLSVETDTLTSAFEGYDYELRNYKGKVLDKGTFNPFDHTFGLTDFGEFNRFQSYKLKLRGFMNYNGVKYYSDPFVYYHIAQAEVKSLRWKGDSLYIKWNKVTGASKYQIYISQNYDQDFKLAKTVGKNSSSVTINKFGKKRLSSKKNYYVEIRTITKMGTSRRVYYWETKDLGKEAIYNSEW